jgi:hypothetical protein
MDTFAHYHGQMTVNVFIIQATGGLFFKTLQAKI